jgi:hypothetical protein
MTHWFGDNLSFTDTSLLEFGIKNREIRSFRAAAQEAACPVYMAVFIIGLIMKMALKLEKNWESLLYHD